MQYETQVFICYFRYKAKELLTKYKKFRQTHDITYIDHTAYNTQYS